MTSLINNFFHIVGLDLLPFLLLVLCIILVMLGHIAKLSERLIFFMVYFLLAVALLVSLIARNASEQASAVGLAFDTLGQLGMSILLLSFLSVVVMAQAQLSDYNHKISSLLLLLLSLLGAMLTAVSHNWLLFFAATQCMSLPIYGLLAFDTNDKTALMTSVRYLVLSSVAMAFTLFGIMALYAVFGTLDFYEQSLLLKLLWPKSMLLILLGFAFILVGMAFKLSLFPFHFWTPKVYQGAKLFMVGHLSVVSKCAMLMAFGRAWFLLFSSEANIISDVLALMAIASMWLGAGLMLFEQNFIRLLAYLSISHLGFLLTALLAQNVLGLEAIFLDLAAFSLSIFLLLAAICLWPPANLPFVRADFTGQLQQHPLAATLLIFAILSLAGLPMTAGFIGKYAVFSAVIDAQKWDFLPHMIITSLLSLLALARFIIVLFDLNPISPNLLAKTKSQLLTSLAMACLIAIFCMGIFPESAISWVKNRSAASSFVLDAR